MSKSNMVSVRLSGVEEKRMNRLMKVFKKGKSEVMRASLNQLFREYIAGNLEVKPKKKKVKKAA